MKLYVRPLFRRYRRPLRKVLRAWILIAALYWASMVGTELVTTLNAINKGASTRHVFFTLLFTGYALLSFYSFKRFQ